MVDVSVDQRSLNLLYNTRAGKLLMKGTPFIVVKLDEPYAKEVYNLVKESEVAKGTWTEEDEQAYSSFLTNIN